MHWKPGTDTNRLVLEMAEHLGEFDGAHDRDGYHRRPGAGQEVTDTGEPISVPVATNASAASSMSRRPVMKPAR